MHYQWQNPHSVIQDIDIYTPGEKQSEALIYAPGNLDMSALAKIPALLRQHGFTVSADNDDAGKPVLRVENFQNKGDLLSLLDQQGLIQGEPMTAPSDNDTKEKKGFNTIKAAGWTYLLADSLIALSGFVRSGKGEGMSEAMGGLTWAAGSVGLIAAGEKDPEIQTGRIYRDLSEYLQNEGTQITPNQQNALNALSSKSSFLAKSQHFMYDHPIEFNNSIQVAGGFLMAKGGLEQRNPLTNQRNGFKVLAGASVMGGMGAGMVLDPKENPYKEGRTKVVTQALSEDEKKAADNGMGPQTKVVREEVAPEEDNRTTWQRMKEAPTYNPMIWAGVGPSINNVSNMVGAGIWERDTLKKFDLTEAPKLGRYKTDLTSAISSGNKLAIEKATFKVNDMTDRIGRSEKFGKGFKLNFGAGVVNLVANALYGISDKDTGVSLKEFGSLDKIYNVAAHIVLAQPAEHRAELIERMSGYFGSQPEVKETSAEVSQDIWQKMADLSQNPWMKVEAAHQAPNIPQGLPTPVITSIASAEAMNDSHMNAQGRA